jgi:hypothetical protein
MKRLIALVCLFTLGCGDSNLATRDDVASLRAEINELRGQIIEMSTASQQDAVTLRNAVLDTRGDLATLSVKLQFAGMGTAAPSTTYTTPPGGGGPNSWQNLSIVW